MSVGRTTPVYFFEKLFVLGVDFCKQMEIVQFWLVGGQRSVMINALASPCVSEAFK